MSYLRTMGQFSHETAVAACRHVAVLPLAQGEWGLTNRGRQAARLADKVLNGTRPAEIPIETPRKLELVINLRVAKEIGLVVPNVLLREADVILR